MFLKKSGLHLFEIYNKNSNAELWKVFFYYLFYYLLLHYLLFYDLLFWRQSWIFRIHYSNHHQYNDLVLKNMSYYYLCWKRKTFVVLNIFVETTFLKDYLINRIIIVSLQRFYFTFHRFLYLLNKSINVFKIS